LKLSKKIWLILGVGVFIIALVYLGMVRFQQIQEQDKLNEELDLTESRLAGVQMEELSSQQAELEAQMSQTEAQFEAVKAMLSQPVGSAESTSVLFESAEDYDLEITELTSSSQTTESLEGVTCSVVSLTAQVEGDAANIVNFATGLNTYFSTGVVKLVAMTIPETASGENATANIQLAIYTYRGD
jgi:hypothetical protein